MNKYVRWCREARMPLSEFWYVMRIRKLCGEGYWEFFDPMTLKFTFGLENNNG